MHSIFMTEKIPHCYPIINFDYSDKSYTLLQRLLSAKAKWIQIRDKSENAEELLRTHGKIILSIRDNISPKSKIIINDYVDIAKEINADGVHLGQGDLSPIKARHLLGEHAIIGLSTHSREQASLAPQSILTYLACGPVYESRTKSGHAAVLGSKGVSLIKEICSIPLVSIGGIDEHNANEVYKAGADSLAIIQRIKEVDDIELFLKTLSFFYK